jgi:[acyl-carrier-protein] S-malonyltransferase
MKPAADKLKQRLAATNLQAPRIPVVNNIEVEVETDPDRIRAALYEQAFGPVRWGSSACARSRPRGIGTLIECGPGKVLAGLVKRIDGSLNSASVYDPATLAEAKGMLA